MPTLHGMPFLSSRPITLPSSRVFRAINPATGENLDPAYAEAGPAEAHQALVAATEATADVAGKSCAQRADFLDRIGQEILALGDTLIERAHAETALPPARLTGERQRTIGQLHLFAEILREGGYLQPVIDRADPDRKPIPKPDLRKMNIPIGPVVVFAASNFPLAFSVAGGDTASALAAGNPVVVKAHPGHPGTSELVAQAIGKAISACNMPAGTFSLLHGTTKDLGLALVRHPATAAVGFTGSLTAGRALFDAAAARPNPIPVFAEMGSTNPLFIFPAAMNSRGNAIAQGLAGSVLLGVGQFCTKPGVIVFLDSPQSDAFVAELAKLLSAASPGTMLYPGILDRFEEGARELAKTPGVTCLSNPLVEAKKQATPSLFATTAENFLERPKLSDEVFGPAALLVKCNSPEQLLAVARHLSGQLTATVHADGQDWSAFAPVVAELQRRAGRFLANGFPTGVEVCHAMVHGGPYPATTAAQSTSVGSAAIERFLRPICFQNLPDAQLPPALQNANPLKLLRRIDGKLTPDAI